MSKEIKNIETARILLLQNLSQEKLDLLARDVDEKSLSLLVAAAIGLSWELKDSKLSSFAIQNKNTINHSEK